MHRNRLRGTYYEMGLEQGRILRRAGFTPPPASPARLRFAAGCEDALRAHAPEFLEEVDGIVAGGGVAADHLKVLVQVLNAVPRCSAVAVARRWTASGQTLFGRDYDYLPSFRRFSQLWRTYRNGALASLGCSDIFVGRWDGVNAAGLAVAAASVAGRVAKPSVMTHLAVRATLDRCRDVPEAVAFLEAIPHVQCANLLVADAAGRIAAFEVSPDRVTTTHVRDDFAAITNHFQSAVMAAGEDRRLRPATSEKRLRNAHEWFAARPGPLTLDDVQALLRDRRQGLCQYNCREEHRPEPLYTLWSWVAALGERRVHLAAGAPVRARYRQYEF